MMTVVVVSSLSIVIIQVRKKEKKRKENDHSDGNHAGNMSICPSALLETANKN